MKLRRRSLLGRILRAPLLWWQHFAILCRHCPSTMTAAAAATRLTLNLFRG